MNVAANAPAFSPMVPPVPDRSRQELLARFVPTAIARVPPIGRVNRPGRVAFLGVITFGMLPLLQLRTRLHRLMKVDQQHAELVVELLKAHSVDATAYEDAARKISNQPWAKPVGNLLTLAAIISMLAYLFKAASAGGGLRYVFIHYPDVTDPRAILSIGLMIAAYVFLHLQINNHIVRVRDLTNALNGTLAHRAESVFVPTPGAGLHPLHLVLGLLLVIIGRVWGLPMMLAWGAMYQFVVIDQRRTRVEVADRLAAITNISPVVKNPDQCRNPQCRQPVPDDAQFCPRCGTAVAVGN